MPVFLKSAFRRNEFFFNKTFYIEKKIFRHLNENKNYNKKIYKFINELRIFVK